MSTDSTKALDILAAVRDQLAAVPGVATCRIGMEANMTPADYPMVRIVPRSITDGPAIGRRKIDALIYFGQPIHEFEAGLEAQYAALLDLERRLIVAGQQTPDVAMIYRRTSLDEDRITAYKITVIECELIG